MSGIGGGHSSRSPTKNPPSREMTWIGTQAHDAIGLSDDAGDAFAKLRESIRAVCRRAQAEAEELRSTHRATLRRPAAATDYGRQ
jgi:hypothetical protein